MSATLFFMGGLVLIYIVASGKAGAVWNALLGTNVPTGGNSGGNTSPGSGNTIPGWNDPPYTPPRTA